jgi:hypothetical protein
VDGLSQPAITINFNYAVTDHTTHTAIAKNSNVTVGQKLDFTFAAYGSHDISWFGTGYSMDSPYGEWRANAAAPPRVGKNVTCNSDDYVVTYYSPNTAPPIKYDVYIPLVVNPPTRTFTPGANLGSCTALVTNPDTSMTETCTVTGTGALNPTFNYSSTYGYFYYRYYDYRDMGPSNGGPGCYGNNIAMKDYGPPPVTGQPQWDSVKTVGSPYQLAVPAKPASYPLTAVPASNQPPAPPSISCPAAATVSQSTSGFSITPTTDPDGDTVRYGIDWTSSGTVTEWIPSSGYLASGASSPLLSSISHNAPSSTGPWTVKVLAEDVNRAQSTWTSCTVPVSNAKPDLTAGNVTPTSATIGVPVNLQATILASTTAATGAGFKDLFQKATDRFGAGATDIGTYTRATSLAAGATDTATLSNYTFTGAPTTWYIRVCADKASAGDTNGSIDEGAYEGNNCGGWTAVNVTNPTPPVLSCTVTPAPPVYQGDTTTWKATATGGTGTYSYTWGAPINQTCTSIPGSCSKTYVVTGTSPLTINATVTSGGAPVSCTSAPTVTPTACTPTLSPSSQTIDKGGTASFTLGANGTHCGFTAGNCTFTDGSAYSSTVSPAATANYSVTCRGTYGLSPPSPPVLVTVRTPDAQIQANGQTGSTRVNASTPNNVTLTWSSANITSCTVTKNGATISTNTSSAGLTQSVTSQTLYGIDCVNSAGAHATDQVVVNVSSSFQNF